MKNFSGLLKILYLISVLLIIHTFSESLNGAFQTCKLSEGNFDTCLASAIESAAKYLKAGLPAYNLPQLDPYELPSLKVGAGAGAVHLVQNYENIVIIGYSTLKVNQSHFDADKKHLSFLSNHPTLKQKANYDISGKVLMLPVHGKGPCTLTLENTCIKHEIQFDEIRKEGDVYYNVKEYVITLQPSHANYLFENLFDGNKLLGDNINGLINREWDTIFQDVREGYEQAYAQIFKKYAVAIFGRVPVNEIFIP